ncbi:DUF3224 domain-containing protein [Mobilicoccus sp.]|uniref:DUF3224 domain-containing protein n=1 Tax=Mobilicoccus sp. TaxID=2034349 RepID=UPI0028A5D1AB|nr:DUF3224 domain-containing protein [Mobilicoccus sp.]
MTHRTQATFEVVDWQDQPVESTVTTGTPIGLALMRKEFHGDIEGWSQTHFLAAYDPTTNTGTYLAIESFTGSVDGRAGTLAIAHSATTRPERGREHELVVIVPGSGTGDLAGLTGTGAVVIDDDGTHHLHLEYAGPDSGS